MESFIGKNFARGNPPVPVTLEQIMKAEVVLLLFSGHWCPPCNGFQPVIKKFYKDVNAGTIGDSKRVEIVYVSCDNTIEEFKKHSSEFIFPVIPFDDPIIAELQDALQIETIPVVTLLRKDGTIAKENIRQIIQTKNTGCFEDIKLASLK